MSDHVDSNPNEVGIQIGTDAACLCLLRSIIGQRQYTTKFYLLFRVERGTSDPLRLKYEGAGDIQPPVVGYTTFETDIRLLIDTLAGVANTSHSFSSVDVYNTNGALGDNVFVGRVSYLRTGAVANNTQTASSTATFTFKDSNNHNFRLRVAGSGLSDSTPVTPYPSGASAINAVFSTLLTNTRFVSRYGNDLTSGLNATFGQSRRIKRMLGEVR